MTIDHDKPPRSAEGGEPADRNGDRNSTRAGRSIDRSDDRGDLSLDPDENGAAGAPPPGHGNPEPDYADDIAEAAETAKISRATPGKPLTGKPLPE